MSNKGFRFRKHKELQLNHKKSNLKNAPRVGCNDMQEANMHSFIKQFLHAEDRKKNSALKDLII